MLGPEATSAAHSPDGFQDLADRLTAYFAGHTVLFENRLDLTGHTAFARRVWEATGQIPWGETRTYRWVAERVENRQASRAVGQALKRNPLPIIIPCHRVVASNGALRGYSGGLSFKKRLLELEATASRSL